MLVACGDDPIAKAEARFRFLQDHGTLGEACDAGRELQALHADKGDVEKYESAKLYASITCRRADQAGRDTPAREDHPASR